MGNEKCVKRIACGAKRKAIDLEFGVSYLEYQN